MIQIPDYVRIKLWEKIYPGCYQDIEKVFGKSIPDSNQVAKWKQEWYDTTPIYININDAMKGYNTAREAGIHPFFYEIWVCNENQSNIHDNASMLYNKQRRISFFSEEHLFLFKLNY